MKDFNEVILTLQVHKGLAQVYKKAIEAENSPKWEENPIKNSKGELISNELKPRWNGNHAQVAVGEDGLLTISLISHTLPNLLEMANWYERMGAKIIYKNSI